MSRLRERFMDRSGPEPSISAGLQEELDRGNWMYDWQLTPSVSTPVISANLAPVHMTRAEMIEPVVRAALAAAGKGATALDLACHEGWFSHRLLEWGADRVVGIDVREQNIRRAELVRDHFGISPTRLAFQRADVLEADLDAIGRFDVVLLLGLIYHLERPMDAIRFARRATGRVCIIESQLTRQDRPIVHGWGEPNTYSQSPASFAAWPENDMENTLASVIGVVSLVPNRAALELMPRWAGFDHVEFLTARSHHDPQYIVGDRAIVAATASGTIEQASGEDPASPSAPGDA